MLAGAYGVTQTAVGTIYSLLLGDGFGVDFFWYRLPDVRFADCETIQNRDCYVICGTPETDTGISVCADKENQLVREVRITFAQSDQSRAFDISLLESEEHIELLKASSLSEQDIESFLHLMRSEPPRSFTGIIQYRQIYADTNLLLL